MLLSLLPKSPIGRLTLLNCNYCGRQPASIINQNGTGACPNCAQAFNTCNLCTHSLSCRFETDPSPLPKQVQQTIRQGNMIMQAIIPNPERIKLCCPGCSCYSEDPFACWRHVAGTCGNYNEYIPSPTPDEKSSPEPETK